MPYPQRWTEDSASAWRWSVQPHSRLQSSQVIGHILLSQICSSCSSSLTLKMKNQRESFLAVLRTCLGYLHTPWQTYWTTLFATTSAQGWNPAIIIGDNLQIDKSPFHMRVYEQSKCGHLHDPPSTCWFSTCQTDQSVSAYLSAVYLTPSFISMNAWCTTEM